MMIQWLPREGLCQIPYSLHAGIFFEKPSLTTPTQLLVMEVDSLTNVVGVLSVSMAWVGVASCVSHGLWGHLGWQSSIARAWVD